MREVGLPVPFPLTARAIFRISPLAVSDPGGADGHGRVSVPGEAADAAGVLLHERGGAEQHPPAQGPVPLVARPERALQHLAAGGLGARERAPHGRTRRGRAAPADAGGAAAADQQEGEGRRRQDLRRLHGAQPATGNLE